MTSRKIVLRFPPRMVDQPIIYMLVKDYNLEFNILKAYVTPREEGLMVLELKGRDDDYDRAVKFLSGMGVQIQSLSQDVVRNEDSCVHCGACVVICPAEALIVDPETRRVLFIEDKCIACELCVPACPPRAMEIQLNGSGQVLP